MPIGLLNCEELGDILMENEFICIQENWNYNNRSNKAFEFMWSELYLDNMKQGEMDWSRIEIICKDYSSWNTDGNVCAIIVWVQEDQWYLCDQIIDKKWGELNEEYALERRRLRKLVTLLPSGFPTNWHGQKKRSGQELPRSEGRRYFLAEFH